MPSLVAGARRKQSAIYYDKGGAVFNILHADYRADPSGGTSSKDVLLQAMADANAAGGGIVLCPPHPDVAGLTTYTTDAVLPVPNNVRVLGGGMQQVSIKRIFVGPIFRFTAANYQSVENMTLDGNAQNAKLVDFLDNGFYAYTKNLYLKNYNGFGYEFSGDAGNSSDHDHIFFEPIGASLTVPAVKLGTDTGPNQRWFTKLMVFNGNPLFDNGASEMNWFIGCGAASVIFSSASSKKTILLGCRVASAGATTTVKGINHCLTTNEFAGPVVLDSTTNTCTYDSNVDSGIADNGTANKVGNIEYTPEISTYGATITPDASKAHTHIVTVTNATAWTMARPSNLPLTGGRQVEIVVKNASGGVMGAGTWNAVYKMAAWVPPANGFNVTILFRWDGTNLIEISRSTNNIPN